MDAGEPTQPEDGPLHPGRDDAEVGGCRRGERSLKESVCSRLASQTVPGRLEPVGGCNVHRASLHTGGGEAPVQTPRGAPPGSHRRGGSGILGAAGSTTVSGSA